ncbi:trehalase family glycosidase [Kiritimatiellota bacterium B12222]|nr:trehalase family glycosidase [Kiritimatiellota bacterium B12222]
MKSTDHTLSFFPYAHADDAFGWQRSPVQSLVGKHDCSLGEWGPYNKRYFGISHLPGPAGVRVDWVVVPELHRRSFHVPAALREAGYLPWQTDPELRRYSYRQQILPKDKLYADISFESDDDGRCLISIALVNQTELAHDVRLHLVAGLQAFATGSWSPKYIQSAQIQLPENSLWLDALSYRHATLGGLSGCEGLANDARRQGEVLGDGLVDGQGMYWPPDRKRDARVFYSFPEGGDWKSFQLRVLSSSPEVLAELVIAGQKMSLMLVSGELSPPIAFPEGTQVCELRFPGGEALTFDGWVLHASKEVSASLLMPDWGAPPDVYAEGRSVGLSWPALEEGYEVEVEEALWIRRLQGDLESCLLLSMHNHVSDVITAAGEGEFVEMILPMVSVPAMDRVIQRYTISGPSPCRPVPHDATKSEVAGVSLRGEDYHFGVERLAAVLFSNVVYPVRIKGQNIRHHPPGRWWDSLYTWDCGFIGLGMGEMSPRRAVELLNTYLTEVGDTESAYVHHGSPVPVQFYVYFDLWQKTQDREMLAFFYPRLKSYLEYLSGIDSRSPTRSFDHHLLQSWELFYNSGGWDDYPPQAYLTQHQDRRAQICPMVVSTHVAIAARIMEMAAIELGEPSDVWRQLVEAIPADMDAYAWDEVSGLYGYLEHDTSGNAVGIFRDPESGESFNQGLDGALPVLTGDCDSLRAEKIWSALANESRFQTPLGLSTVDQRAPYYSAKGYWNGAVWVPYQYLFWRGALDAGRAEFARMLAEKVLKTWQRETLDAYACFEHFMVESGRGAGWHHFGGLSSPVLNLFAAYFVPGRISTGFRSWIHDQQWSADLRSLTLNLTVQSIPGGDAPICVVCMPVSPGYRVKRNGGEFRGFSVHEGCLDIPLLSISGKQTLEIFCE